MVDENEKPEERKHGAETPEKAVEEKAAELEEIGK